MQFFEKVALAPVDPILGLTAAYNADSRENKVNLGVGLYKDENLKTSVMRSVKIAEENLIKNESNKDYLPIEGEKIFIERAGELVFGKDLWSKESHRIAGFQTIGGTGALRIGATFLKKEAPANVYISHPTWPNHRGVFTEAALTVDQYPYYDITHHRLEYAKMLASLESLPSGSIIVFHASCQNPTGSDLSSAQWEEVASLCQKRSFLPFFDCAYQGFGKGLEQDAESIRLFLRKGLECLVAVSNSKNFSLYGERVGSLFVITASSAQAKNVMSRMKQIIRTHYSNPPMHGAKIVAHVLSDASLRASWEKELNQMCQRINQVRTQLADNLISQTQKIDFRYLHQCAGMFCFSGLNKPQVERLMAEFGIYMTADGRINVCGLNQSNLDYVSNAILAVIE